MSENNPPPTCPPEAGATPAAVALRAFHDLKATPRQREEAANQMFNAYWPWVKRHLRQWPGLGVHEVEDAMAEAMRRFYKNAPPDHPQPEAWLRLTFNRILIDQYYQHQTGLGGMVPLHGTGDDGSEQELQVADRRQSSDPAEIVMRQDLLAKLLQRVERDRPQDLKMFLDYADSKDPDDIARELGITNGTLRQRMSYLRRFLRRALKLNSSGDLA